MSFRFFRKMFEQSAKLLLCGGFMVLPFWTCAQDGLFNRLGRGEGMQTDRVYDLQRDRIGRLWFAGANGVYLLKGDGFKRIAPDDLFEAQILGLSIDPQNRIWCYTSEGKLYRLDHNRWLSFALNIELCKILEGRIINTMQFDSSGVAWVSTVFGGMMLKVDVENANILRVQLPVANPHTQFVKRLDNEQFIWGSAPMAQSNEHALACYLGEQTLRIKLSGQNDFSKSSFIPLSENSYLFGLDNELIQFSADKIIARRFVDKPIECLYEDFEGKIWVGLNRGGLLVFPTGAISETAYIEYLGNKSVTAIHEDATGRLWACTAEDGIYYHHQGLHISYVQPSIIRNLEENQIVEGVSVDFLKRSGKTDIDVFRSDTVPPTITFTGFQINGNDTSLNNHTILDPDQNFIKFYFVGSSPTNPGVFQYKYILYGADKRFVYTSSNFAHYTTLPPGKYRFEVSAMNKEGIWSIQPAVFHFSIRPYFYQTTLFIVLCVLVLAVFIILVIYLWSQRYKKKQQTKAALDKHIAALELSALRAQMNPHFIFNTLSSIQYFVSANNTEEALRYLSKFASLMRIILNNSRKKVITLKDELKAIQLYLELEKLRFRKKFEFDIIVDPEVDPEYDTLPSMLIQPFVENSILHGIMHKDGTGKVEVRISKMPGHLVCIITDDGIGREKSAELKRTEHKMHESQGMSITRDRLEIINRVNSSHLSAQIEDLKTPTGHASGTRIKIFIPIEHE